jgi:hypothetical protein
MKKNFLDIEVGDKVIVCDEYSHDYEEHTLQVDSIEYDAEWATEANPKGMHCYGTDLEEEEWGDDYITQVTEGNFCRFEADYTPSAENGDYSPSNPWDAPGMKMSDFI